MKNLILFLSITALLVACSKNEKESKKTANKLFDSYTEIERDSIAERYNAWANYFSQPTFAYRLFKDSANLAQPNNTSYLQTKSYSYKKRGEHLTAMNILNKVVQINVEKGSIDALQYRAWTLLYFYRDYEGAIQDIEKIEKMSADDYSQCWGEPCSFQKAQAFYKTDNYLQAISTLQYLINLEIERYESANNHLYYFYLARSQQKIGEESEAIKSFQAALKVYPQFCEGHFYLAELYETLGNSDKATEHYKLALKYQNYKMNEPYIERFDEVFTYQIEKKLRSNLQNE